MLYNSSVIVLYDVNQVPEQSYLVSVYAAQLERWMWGWYRRPRTGGRSKPFCNSWTKRVSQVTQVTPYIYVYAPRYYFDYYCSASWKEYMDGKITMNSLIFLFVCFKESSLLRSCIFMRKGLTLSFWIHLEVLSQPLKYGLLLLAANQIGTMSSSSCVCPHCNPSSGFKRNQFGYLQIHTHSTHQTTPAD